MIAQTLVGLLDKNMPVANPVKAVAQAGRVLQPSGQFQGLAAVLAGYKEQVSAIPGVRIEAGNLRGYADGPMGFAVDNPSFVIPDGPRLPTRLSAVLRLEDGSWKLLNAHFSIGVPNEEVFELMDKWATAQTHGI